MANMCQSLPTITLIKTDRTRLSVWSHFGKQKIETSPRIFAKHKIKEKT
jgi:hypothetical protein